MPRHSPSTCDCKDISIPVRECAAAQIDHFHSEPCGVRSTTCSENRECIAADTKDFCPCSKILGETIGDRHENFIAALVAKAGVNGFEAVDIQKNKRGVAHAFAELFQLFHQPGARFCS